MAKIKTKKQKQENQFEVELDKFYGEVSGILKKYSLKAVSCSSPVIRRNGFSSIIISSTENVEGKDIDRVCEHFEVLIPSAIDDLETTI